MSYETLVESDSPLAYYALQESTGTTAADSSGNGYDATIDSGVALAHAGPFSDNAMGGFGAGKLIRMPTGISWSSSVAHTVEFWYKQSNPTEQGIAFTFGTPDPGSSGGHHFLCYCPYSSTIYFDAANNASDRITFGWPGAATGVWTHFAFVSDDASGDVAIWVSGVKQAHAAWSSQVDMFLGGLIGGSSDLGLYTSADIAHFAVYDAALADARILAHASYAPAVGAAFSSSGVLSSAGALTRGGACSLSSAGTLTVSTASAVHGAAALSSAGALTSAGRLQARGTVAMSSTGALAAAEASTIHGAAALASTGTLNATGRLRAAGISNLTSTGALTGTAASSSVLVSAGFFTA